MKQRIGLVLAVAGVILLLEPGMDWQNIATIFGEWSLQYWPAGLILFGAVLISPRKKKKRSAR